MAECPSQNKQLPILKHRETLLATLLLSATLFWTVLLLAPPGATAKGPYEWMKQDHFDEIDKKFHATKPWNCRSRGRENLLFRPDTVAQLPVYNQLLSRVWYKNRTTLIHLHNMALNRAMFYRYAMFKKKKGIVVC